jgi:hypothetical protein
MPILQLSLLRSNWVSLMAKKRKQKTMMAVPKKHERNERMTGYRK